MAKSRLNKVITETNEFQEISASKRDYEKIKKKQVRDRLIKKTLFIACPIVIIILALYVPGYFMKDAEEIEKEYKAVSYNSESLGLSKYIYQNSPTEDFDNDGLINRDEINKGADGYFFDTDLDGLSDIYESKNGYDIKEKNENVFKLKALDYLKTAGKIYSDAYKIDDVTLWASDESSRVNGTMTYTFEGYYSFKNFKGRVSVPGDKYLYIVKNGIKTELEYDSSNKCYFISSDCVVAAQDSKLDMTCKITLPGKGNDNPIYMADNIFTKVVAFVLPDKGWITGQRMAKEDTNNNSTMNKSIDITGYTARKLIDSRLRKNDISIKSLQEVRASLDKKNPVTVSLLNISFGEYVGIVSGYTLSGDLIISDAKSKAISGVLKITEKAINEIDGNGNLKTEMYYDFEGLGCDSLNGDRISFVYN